MHLQLLFFSMAPIIAFTVFRDPERPQRGPFAAISVAAVELGYNSFSIERIEPFSLLSFTLFSLLGALSVQYRNELWVKLQPTAIEIVVAAIFVYYSLVLGTPLLPIIVDDYIGITQLLPSYQRGYATVYATTLSRSLPYLLVGHALLMGWAATKGSLRIWFQLRILGFYLPLALLFLAERLLDVTP